MRYLCGMSEDELIEKLVSESSPEGVRDCLKQAGFKLTKDESAPAEGGEEEDDSDFPAFQKKTVKKNMAAFGADKEEEPAY